MYREGYLQSLEGSFFLEFLLNPVEQGHVGPHPVYLAAAFGPGFRFLDITLYITHNLKHSSFSEDQNYNKNRDNHQHQQNKKVRQPAAGHRQVDIHAVDGGYESRRHQEEGHEGEDLHDAVLFEVDQTDYCVLEVVQTLEAEIGMVEQGDDVLVDDRKFRKDIAGG